MKVEGTVTINYSVNLDVNDISEDAMDMYDSDVLIAKEIDKLLPRGFYVEGEINVKFPYGGKLVKD